MRVTQAKLFCLLLVCGTLVFGATVLAQAAYPTKQVTVLQGFKPGGGSDTLAQLTQPFLEKELGKSFINQYIPGATGAIAWTKLAKATKPDGYTISITNTPMLQTNYIMNKEITYNIKEMEPIANVITDPGIIVVAANSPYKTFKDFADACKATPGRVTVANSGTGGDDFFTSLIFEKNTGLKIQMVPFEGDGPSWQAAMGGKVDVSFNNLGITYPQLKGGNLRALAIFADARYPLLPDVPTVKELGYDIVSGSSRGYSAPKGIPAEAKAVLIAAFKKISQNPDFLKACDDRASVVDMKYGDDYKVFLEKEEQLFGKIWDEVKAQYTAKQ